MRFFFSVFSSGSRVFVLLKSMVRSCLNVFVESSRVFVFVFRKWNVDFMSLRLLFYVLSSRLCVRMRRVMRVIVMI